MCIHTHTFAVIIIQIFNNQHDRHESIGMDANSIYWLSEYQYKKKIFVVKKKVIETHWSMECSLRLLGEVGGR